MIVVHTLFQSVLFDAYHRLQSSIEKYQETRTPVLGGVCLC